MNGWILIGLFIFGAAIGTAPWFSNLMVLIFSAVSRIPREAFITCAVLCISVGLILKAIERVKRGQ